MRTQSWDVGLTIERTEDLCGTSPAERARVVFPQELGSDLPTASLSILVRRKFGIEVPIHYDARTIQSGKKIRWRDGLSAMATLRRWRRWQAPDTAGDRSRCPRAARGGGMGMF